MMRQKVNWNLSRRVGIILILIATSNIIFYNNIHPNYIKTVLTPEKIVLPGNNQSVSLSSSSFLYNQKNQFIQVNGTCISCSESAKVNITVLYLMNHDYLTNRTLLNLSLVFQKNMIKTFSLDPGYYVFVLSVQGNNSVNLDIVGYGEPNGFIITNVLVLFSGISLVLVHVFYTRRKTPQT